MKHFFQEQISICEPQDRDVYDDMDSFIIAAIFIDLGMVFDEGGETSQ